MWALVRLFFILVVMYFNVVPASSSEETLKPFRNNEKLFFETFDNNSQLVKSDFDFFPAEFKKYLQVHPGSNFRNASWRSQKIGSRLYLIISKQDGSGFASRAAVFTTDGMWRDGQFKWNKLFLARLGINGKIHVSDLHFDLKWDETRKSAYTTYCSDTGGGCVRSYYKIFLNENRLFKVEHKSPSAQIESDWETIWENGQWSQDNLLSDRK